MQDSLPYLMVIALFFAVYQLARISERLRAMETRLDILLRHAGISYGEVLEPSDRVKELAKDPRQKIAAIKAYRQQTGLGLKEAKAIVDGLATPR